MPDRAHDRHQLCRMGGPGRCDSVRYFDAIFQTPAVGIALVDRDGRFIDGNVAMLDLLGYTPEELATLTFRDVTHPEDHELASDGYRALIEGLAAASHLEKRYVRKDGSHFWGQLSLSVIDSDGAAPVCFLAIVTDIGRRKEAERHMTQRSAYLQLLSSVAVEANEASTLEAAVLKCLTLVCSTIDWPVGHVYFPSLEHPLLLTSGSLWYLEDPARFRPFQEHSEQTCFSPGVGLIGQVFQSGRPAWIPDVSRDARFLRAECAGRTGLRAALAFPLMVGPEVAGVMEFFTTDARDVDSELLAVMGQIGTQLGRVIERRRAGMALEAMAYTDALTRLPNRALFTDRLEQAIGRAGRHGRQVGVLYLNLDRFTLINETMGHDRGDELLQQVGERLLSSVRAGDTVGRLGGDEFTVLLPDIQEAPEVAAVAQEILAALNRPFLLAGQELVVTPSIGISSYPTDGTDALTLVRNADAAMHRAKSQHNVFQHYAPRMNDSTGERLVMEQQLRRAIERNELLVHYQPQVCLRTGRVIGAEALVRWQHPQLGLVSPAKFIPLAEETGLIVPMTEWILRTVCEQGRRWQGAALPPLRLSVNLSGCHFRRQNLVSMVSQVLRQTGFDPAFLELELTESILMEDVEATIATLEQLRELGLHFSIDDFGTGYSSLSYLKRFPIQVLKIDRSFVRDIAVDEDDRSIVGAIIAMAHSLQLQVTAEGVEDELQAAFLKERGCDSVQGYLYSKPVPSEALEHFLQKASAA